MKTIKLHTFFKITLLWSFFITQGYAQKLIHFNEKKGFPSNHVYRIVQDNDGFIWMITDNGMVKYNGKSFKIFTTKNGLPTNEIWDIRVGHDNKIWYFTKANKLGYIKNDTVFSFKSSQKSDILYPKSINQNTNKISFYDRRKKYEIVEDKWKSEVIYKRNGYQESVLHDKVDHVFIYFKSDSLKVIDKKGHLLKSYKTKFAFETCYYKGQVNDSLFCWIKDNEMCFLNLNSLKIIEKKLAIKSKKFIRFTAVNNNIQFSGENFVGYLSDQYTLNGVIEIPKKIKSHFSFIDKNKNIWIATFGDGVYFFPYTKQHAKYRLHNQKVRKLQKINAEIIASVYRKGIYKYNSSDEKFNAVWEIDNYMYDVNYIKELDVTYYMANQAILKVSNEVGSSKLKKTTLHNPENERSLVYLNGYLYANTSYGINKIDPKTDKKVKEYSQNGILSLLKYNNNILIATVSGIKVLQNDSIKPLKGNRKLVDMPVTSMTKINDAEIIVCTKGFGAYITNFSKTEMLEKSDFLNVHSAFVDNNEVWLATHKGVWYYKKVDNTFKYISNYTTNDGLSSSNVSSVIVDNDEMITSSNEGVSIIPIKKEKNNQFINIYIDDVIYHNKSVINNNIKYSIGGQLIVKVESIDFSKNKDIEFSYKLKPIQNKWVTSKSNHITFADLPPHKYQLSIKYGNKSDSVKFVITPLWYQTGLFKIGFVIFGLFLVLLMINHYQNKIKRKAQIQQRLVEQELHALRSQMNPHFVFNSLSAIQYYITQNNFKASEEYLILFSSLIRQFFELSSEKEISLKDEIRLLNSYLKIEKLRFKEKLSYVITVDDTLNIDALTIPTMLLQPIVENAVNHGIFNKKENGTITIEFSAVDSKTYKVLVIDDGVGVGTIEKGKKKRKNSSQVLKDRLRYLNKNKEWKIQYNTKDLYPNKTDKGTVITFTITKL